MLTFRFLGSERLAKEAAAWPLDFLFRGDGFGRSSVKKEKKQKNTDFFSYAPVKLENTFK